MWIYYDTETTGKCHPFDQILQIAAIVTSKKWREFETINDRCRLRPDVIPTPEAMLITRQRPSDLNDKSRKTHYEMFDDYDRFLKERIISQKDRGGDLNGYTRERPITFKGHNILAFDEYAYRMDTHMTLHNPYIHMMEGCARFDTLVAAQAIAIYGSGKMRFPLTEKGNLSFRLGAMCEVNDIVVDHSDLHDALADVRYTIKLDEKMAKSEPELYYQLDLMANKQDVRAFCEKNEVFSYSLMHFGKPKTGFFTSIANEDDRSRKTSNDQLMWDLSQDPEEYFDKSVEELSEFFSKSKKGNAFKMRSAPVLWCRRNEQPMMMPMNLVSESFKEGYIQEAQEDGGVKSLSSVESEDVMHERAQKIKNNPEFIKKLNQAYKKALDVEYDEKPYPQEWIYEGFPDKQMKEWMTRFHKSDWEAKKDLLQGFQDRFSQELKENPKLKRYCYFGILIVLENAPRHVIDHDPVWADLDRKFKKKRAIAQLSTNKYHPVASEEDFKMTLPYARMRMEEIRREIVTAKGDAQEALQSKYNYQDKREILPLVDSWLRYYDQRIEEAIVQADLDQPQKPAAKKKAKKKKPSPK